MKVQNGFSCHLDVGVSIHISVSSHAGCFGKSILCNGQGAVQASYLVLGQILFASQYETTERAIPIFLMSKLTLPGRVAQSVGHLTRKSEVMGSISSLATYFRFSFP